MDSVSFLFFVIIQENLGRVKCFGCFDYVQWQFGECCLYVFLVKVELVKIVWECLEKNCVQGEGFMVKKVKCLLKKQVVWIMLCFLDIQCFWDYFMEDLDKKGEIKVKSEVEFVSFEEMFDGFVSLVEMQDEGVEEFYEVGEQLFLFLLKEGREDRLQLVEQDVDDEVVDDMDDISLVIFFVSFIIFFQSGSGMSCKKSIFLFIKNLKCKYKRKKNKII